MLGGIYETQDGISGGSHVSANESWSVYVFKGAYAPDRRQGVGCRADRPVTLKGKAEQAL